MSQLTPIQSSFNWLEAIKIINDFKYGNEIGRKNLPQSIHRLGTKIHAVNNFEVLFNPVQGFEFKGYFVFCKTCNSTRQKRLVLFNNDRNLVFLKDIIKDDHVTNE